MDSTVLLDPDLQQAMTYNPQSFTQNDIAEVVGIAEGERDEAPWHWLVSLKDGRWAYMVGGCDYSGWDCQSWLESYIDGTSIGVMQIAYARNGTSESRAKLDQISTQWGEYERRKLIAKSQANPAPAAPQRPLTKREQVGLDLAENIGAIDIESKIIDF